MEQPLVGKMQSMRFHLDLHVAQSIVENTYMWIQLSFHKIYGKI